ncbi:hypothetical protein protein [Bacillus cereus G9241]|nr:hypothetical protein protein [Bacillus cereus G9241]
MSVANYLFYRWIITHFLYFEKHLLTKHVQIL